MFNRLESYKKAIQGKNIDSNTLSLMIDFHVTKGTLTEVESEELTGLMGVTKITETEDLLLTELGV